MTTETSYPDTKDGWRRVIRGRVPVLINGNTVQAAAGTDPDELLDMRGVGEETWFLRHPHADPTLFDPVKATGLIRYYKQIGNLPVAPVQEGGRWPNPGETIPVNGQTKHTPGHRVRRHRIPREGEKIGATCAWPRWMIWQWNAHRRGPGRAFVPGRVSGNPQTKLQKKLREKGEVRLAAPA